MKNSVTGQPEQPSSPEECQKAPRQPAVAITAIAPRGLREPDARYPLPGTPGWGGAAGSTREPPHPPRVPNSRNTGTCVALGRQWELSAHSSLPFPFLTPPVQPSPLTYSVNGASLGWSKHQFPPSICIKGSLAGQRAAPEAGEPTRA